MNERAALPLSAILSLLLALMLGGCASEAAPPPLEGATMGGPFTLTDQTGARVSDTDFRGKYRLVYFGYSFCPDVCPTDLQTIGAGFRQLEQSDPDLAAKVQPIFITADPARDTPAVLRQFVPAFHPRLIGLTGSEQEIAQVARAHGIFYTKTPGASPQDYLVDHSRMAVLYGPEGEPVAIIPHDQGPAGVAEELKRWIR